MIDDYEGEIKAWRRRLERDGDTIHVSNSQNVTIASRSNHVTQASTYITNSTLIEIREWANRYQDQLAELDLDDDDSTKATTLLAQVHTQLDTPEPDPGVMKWAIRGLAGLAFAAAGNAAGSGLFAGAQTILAAVGS